MKILFQGDSITDGNRYKDKNLEWDKNHQIGHSYVYITTGLLSLKYFSKGFELVTHVTTTCSRIRNTSLRSVAFVKI